ncbi:sulfatase-like hydrolase/transferase [Patescibacteria group bacterium]|nr:sulfatase-like hydrolase/transferase [Patescibacteria group bacterium]
MNILILLVDALRADRVLGDNRRCQTPNIDKLRQQGTCFSQAIAQASFTSSSVAAILTGTYSFVHGVRSLRGYKLSSEVTTLAQILRRNGYHTFAEVTGPLIPEMGLDRGFDKYHYRDVEENAYTAWGDSLIKMFKEKTYKGPWFGLVHFWVLHEQVGREREVPKEFNQSKYGKCQYDRAVSAFDNWLGQLLRTLDEDTLVILLSDHGEQIFKNNLEKWQNRLRRYSIAIERKLGKSQKYFLEVGHGFHVYDYLVRIPLILKGSRIPQGKVISQQVQQVDLLPSILELAGVSSSPTHKVFGQTLVPLMNGRSIKVPPAYMEACDDVFPDETKWLAGIRTSDYKYVCGPYNDKIKSELYDLKSDPSEKKNLYGSQPELAQRLKKQMDEIREYEGKTMKIPGERMNKKETAKLENRLKELGYM